MISCRNKQSGFTLIEIAVVLVIVGMLVGSFIGTFAERIDTTRRENTKNNLAEIKSVLMAYAFSRPAVPYLPCPDTDVPPDGVENRAGGVCAATTGILPWVTIGAGYADAWDTRYDYWVNTNYANDAGFQLLTDDGLNSATIETRVGNNNMTLLNIAVAVIYSHGKNGLGGVSSGNINRAAVPAVGYDDENENADADNLFMSRSTTKEGAVIAGGIFDDIVTWINSYELKAKMVETGKLP